MDYYSSQINKLIQELSELPGIGAKSAQRLAFHILNMPVEQVEGLSEAIINARKNVRYCKECFTLTDDELCPICKDKLKVAAFLYLPFFIKAACIISRMIPSGSLK